MLTVAMKVRIAKISNKISWIKD